MTKQSTRRLAVVLVTLSAAVAGARPAFAADPPAVKPAAEKPAAGEVPADKPGATDKPAAPKGPARLTAAERNAVNAASVALLAEYAKAMKKNGEGLRDKCDYFPKEKPAGVTPETVIAALERRHGSDPRAEAYVKWQLLSGIDGKIPAELRARAIQAYRAAPQPPRHPGLNKGGLDRILNRAGIMKKELEPDINKEYSGEVDRYRLAIEPFLEYRDEFYSRLGTDLDSFQAGLGDLYDRVTAGAPANEFWTNLSAALRSWALTSTDPRQVRLVAGVVQKVRDTNRDERNRPYAKVAWNNDKGLLWQAESAVRDDKSLEETVAWLVEQAKNPGGGLGFKDALDEKKPKK